jgi:hypothetical protein
MFQALSEQVKKKKHKTYDIVITRLTIHARNSFSYNNNTMLNNEYSVIHISKRKS